MTAKTPTTEKKTRSPFAFFSSAIEELKKVHRPTKEETIQSAIGVLMLIVMFSLFLGSTDWFIGTLIRWILSFS